MVEMNHGIPCCHAKDGTIAKASKPREVVWYGDGGIAYYVLRTGSDFYYVAKATMNRRFESGQVIVYASLVAINGKPIDIQWRYAMDKGELYWSKEAAQAKADEANLMVVQDALKSRLRLFGAHDVDDLYHDFLNSRPTPPHTMTVNERKLWNEYERGTYDFMCKIRGLCE